MVVHKGEGTANWSCTDDSRHRWRSPSE